MFEYNVFTIIKIKAARTHKTPSFECEMFEG
jgi:hypothetical protein